MAAAQRAVGECERGARELGSWTEARTWRACRPWSKHEGSNRSLKDFGLHPKCGGKPMKGLRGEG